MGDWPGNSTVGCRGETAASSVGVVDGAWVMLGWVADMGSVVGEEAQAPSALATMSRHRERLTRRDVVRLPLYAIRVFTNPWHIAERASIRPDGLLARSSKAATRLIA
jgi:hypothetical protein